jgi:hypothetical protein
VDTAHREWHPSQWRQRPSLFFLWLPGLGTIAWVMFTLSLFLFGPYTWYEQPKGRLIVFMTITLVLFTLGYWIGVRRRSAPHGPDRPPRRLLMWAGIFMFTPLMASVVTGDFFRALNLARTDLSQAYVAWGQAAGTSFWPYFDMAIAPIAVVFIPVSLYYWRTLRFGHRIALVTVVSVTLLAAAASARRSGVVATLILTLSAVAARVGGSPSRQRARALRRLAVAALVATVVLVPFLHYVAENRSSGMDPTWNPVAREFPDPGHFLARTIPLRYQSTAFSAVFYLSHGYYALARTLDMPFKGITFGLGQSWFLRRNAERLGVAPAVVDLSYDLRLLEEEGYPVGLWWMTIFPWYASDVTFPGTWLLTFILGFGLARAWERSCMAADPWSITLLPLLIHMAFSIPLNNPMQDGSGITRLFGVIFMTVVASGFFRRRRPIPARAVHPSPPSGTGSPRPQESGAQGLVH